ncbi:MAG: beta galactosidase jelly roll domain-containing protein [Ignavibacteriales bacterium]
MKISSINCFALAFLLCAACLFSTDIRGAEKEKRYVNLEGKWKFSIGDDKKWALPDFDDRNWEEIHAPDAWEDQGFYGYNGYGWYRKRFFCPSEIMGKTITLHMGYIDDVDEIYINGKLVGSSGLFPPEYRTAYNAYRKYAIPESFLKPNGDNVIAVKVYDAQLGGGIISGDLGLFASAPMMRPDVVLEGLWKFRIGDRQEWNDPGYNDKAWGEIIVPSYWETQGYQDYDGFAWYRKKITIPDYLKDKQLVLMLGKIDDKDEVYFNGRQIGHTGDLNDPETNDRDYQMFRGYYIPKDLVRINRDNVIAVRVYDGYIDGGIYEGPVGITTHEKYSAMWKLQKKKKSFWDLMIGN